MRCLLNWISYPNLSKILLYAVITVPVRNKLFPTLK